MEKFAFIYLIKSAITEVVDFVTHWYVGGARVVLHALVGVLERLDRTFALRITWRYITEPLFGDQTVVGHIIGFIFRSARLLVGGALYAVVVLIAAATYLGWAAVLPFIFYKIFYV